MVRININFSNKTFYLLVSVLGLLTISAIVFAYGGNNPAIHGHDSGELEDHGHDASEITGLPSGGSRSCTLGYDGSDVTEIKNTAINLPDICLDGKVCEIFVKHLQTPAPTFQNIMSVLYSQKATEVWAVSTSGYNYGTNGDSTRTTIIPISGAPGIYLADDMTGVETNPNKITYVDGYGYIGLKIYFCETDYDFP
jgi:hypothetical protein